MNTDNKLLPSIVRPAIATAALLMIPLVAMQFTGEVAWDKTDFLVAGVLIFGTGLTYTLITRKSENMGYRVAIGFALFTGLFLVWVNMAVGIIGSSDNPFNLVYFGVIAVGIIGALIARFRARGMALVMVAMALSQSLIAVIALANGMQQSPVSPVHEILGVNGFFVALFLASALLFRYAASREVTASTTAEDGVPDHNNK